MCSMLGPYYKTLLGGGGTFQRQDLDKGSQIIEACTWGKNWDSRSFLSISSQPSWAVQVSSHQYALYCSGLNKRTSRPWTKIISQRNLSSFCSDGLRHFVTVTGNWRLAKRGRLELWPLSHNCIPETCRLWWMVCLSLPTEVGRKIIITKVFRKQAITLHLNGSYYSYRLQFPLKGEASLWSTPVPRLRASWMMWMLSAVLGEGHAARSSGTF